jgi:hypothetical protein
MRGNARIDEALLRKQLNYRCLTTFKPRLGLSIASPRLLALCTSS